MGGGRGADPTASTGGTAQLWDGSTGWSWAAAPTGCCGSGTRTTGSLLWTLPAHKSEIYGVHIEGADVVTRGITGELVRWTLPDPG